MYYPGATGQLKRDTTADRRDIDVIRDHHRLDLNCRALRTGFPFLGSFGKRRMMTPAGRFNWPGGTTISCSRNTAS